MTQHNAAPDLLDLGDVQIAHTRTGQGPDLVFVHGWPLCGDTWRNVVAGLESDFTCHVIDLPGAGASTHRSDYQPSLRTHPDVVERVVDHLGLGRFGLVGHDSGGMIARFVAAELGDRVAGLVVSGTEIPGHHPALLKLYRLTGRSPGNVGVMRTLLSVRALRHSPLVFGGCFGDVSFGDGEFFEVMVRPLIEDRTVLAGQLEVLATLDNSQIDELARIHARIVTPTLLVWGADDTIYFPEAKARAMTSQFGGRTRFESIPDAKLFVHEERAAELAALARDFLVDAFEPISRPMKSSEA